MTLSRDDLNKIDDGYIDSLSEGQMHKLCCRLRDDLIELHDRLNQNPSNSSLPPSSREPWFSPDAADGNEETDQENPLRKSELDDFDRDGADDDKDEDPSSVEKSGKPRKRKAGKQEGAQGYGRTQKLPLTRTIVHRATKCEGCTHILREDTCLCAAGQCHRNLPQA